MPFYQCVAFRTDIFYTVCLGNSWGKKKSPGPILSHTRMRVGKKCIALLYVNINSVSLPGELVFSAPSRAEPTTFGPALLVTTAQCEPRSLHCVNRASQHAIGVANSNGFQSKFTQHNVAFVEMLTLTLRKLSLVMRNKRSFLLGYILAVMILHGQLRFHTEIHIGQLFFNMLNILPVSYKFFWCFFVWFFLTQMVCDALKNALQKSQYAKLTP